MAVEFRVGTATVDDLSLLEEWTSWIPGRDVPCVVGGDNPAEAFKAGRLRVISAAQDGECIGISLVADPSHAIRVDSWRLPSSRTVPGAECLVWVGMAICPTVRQTGLAAELVHHTLDMAATTGYPFVAAVFPIQDARASALLVRHGFVRVDQLGCEIDARPYCVFLSSTPTLSDDRTRAEIAC